MILYLKVAGGNWSAASSWSATSSGGVDNAGPPAVTDDVIMEALSGNLTVDVTSTCKSLSMIAGSGSYAGAMNHNGVVLTIAGSCTFSSGCTYTPLATSTLTFSSNGTLTTAGKLMPLIVQTGSAALTLGDNLNYMASKVLTHTLQNTSSLNLNGFTLSGNSITNRILLQSNTIGTSHVLTVAGGAFANVDFKDVQFSNATNLDLSAITGGSGDCGGNSITGGGSSVLFTPAVNDVVTAATSKSMSDPTIHSSGRTPLPQDNISLSGVTGGTLSFDMPRLGRDVDWTGATGNPAMSLGQNSELYGSLTMIVGMTSPSSNILSFAGRTTHTITCAGKTFTSGATLGASPAATYSQNDAYALSATFTLASGNWVTNGFAFTVAVFINSNSNGRGFFPSTSTITLTNTATSTVFNQATTANLTYGGGKETILISTVSANARTISLGTLSYGVIKYILSGSTGELDLVHGGAFIEGLSFSDSTNVRTLKVSAGQTLVVRNGSKWLVNGSSGKLGSLTSTTASVASIRFGSYPVSCDFLNISNIAAVGVIPYAGVNSIDGGGNSGWVFSTLPSSPVGTIQFDAAENGSIVNPGTSLTWQHTCAGNNRILFVSCFGNTVDQITGVTYGGAAMTLINKVDCPTDRYVYLFYLIAPSVGTNDVVVSASGSTAIAGSSVSYTGANQTSQPDAQTTNTATAVTGISTSITVGTSNCWGVIAAKGTSSAMPTAGTNSFLRAGANDCSLLDTNGQILSLGSFTMTINAEVGSKNFGVVMASFKPVAGGTQAKNPNLMLMGVG